MVFQSAPLAQCSLEVKPAWRHNDEFRVSFTKFVKRDSARMFTFFSEPQIPVRDLDQFRPPISHRKERVHPLQHYHRPPASPFYFFLHRFQTTPLLANDSAAVT